MNKRYVIELNAAHIRDYCSKARAMKFAKSKADPRNIVRLWDIVEKAVIWDNEEQYIL